MTRSLGTTRWIVCAAGFFGAVGIAFAQESTNAPSATNQAPDIGALEIPTLTTNTYGAQPVPNEFETQNNLPTVAGPSVLGGGQLGSPLMGTSPIGVGLPGFSPIAGPGLYHEGLLDLHARLGYSFLYASGLDTQPGQHNGTVANTISPGVTAFLGSHLTLDYSASAAFYSGSTSLGNSTAQDALLRWSANYQDWALGLSQSYSTSSALLVETGTQTEEDAYITALSVSRKLGDNFSVAFGFNQSFRFVNQFDSVRSWNGDGSLNYNISPRVQLGLTVGGGYNDMSLGSSMTSEDYQGVLMIRPGEKLTLSISGGGIQEESFTAGNLPSLVTPIFSAALQYQLFVNTSITLNAGRTVNPSFFSNEVVTATAVGVGLAHHFSPKLSLALAGGYIESSYDAIVPGPLPKNYLGVPTSSPLEVTRDDSGSYGIVSLSYIFVPRLTGSASYSITRNSSSQSNFSYTSSQVGVQVTYQY